MNIRITDTAHKRADTDELNTIHLSSYDECLTACGLQEHLYFSESSEDPITCTKCIYILEWCKQIVNDNT